MLLPEVPAATGTGGQVRIYHFVEAATQVANVTIAILAEPDAGDVPPELNVQRIIRPESNSPRVQGNAGPKGAFRVLTRGGRNHGRALVLAGQNICVDRSGNHHSGPFHKIYGWLLLLQTSLLNHIMALFPIDIHLRGGSWDAIQSKLSDLPSPPDYVWYEHSYLFPLTSVLRKRFPEAQIIVNAHNVEWVLKDSIALTRPAGLARRWTELESSMIKRWETRMVCESTLIYACSEEDKQRLQAHDSQHGAEIVVIPNGVDVDHFVPQPRKTETPTLLFAGTAGYPPNDDAVDWLTTDIFPKIRKQLDDCRLILAGRNADKNWGHLHSPKDGIQVASNVPDMRPLLGSAWVSVVPLRSGSGTRLKIVEAMSSGRCVVSTTIGAEGLNLISETDLMIRDTAEDFATAVCAVIKDGQLRTTLEENGRQIACQRFSWQQLASTAADVFQKQIETGALVVDA
jgi:glycosyltransferase involved in cell wall biosynthesis